MVNGSLVTKAWHVLGVQMEGWSPVRGGVVANTLNKQPQTANKGCVSCLGLGVGLITLHRKKEVCYKILKRAGIDSLDIRPK
jgi:hypothetical protein